MMSDSSPLQTNMPLVSSYKPWLGLLSIAVAVVALYVALDLTGRAWRDEGSYRRWWLIGGASAMGTGIWAMHFIGMLAFQLPVSIRYDVGTVALSLAVAVLASGMALSTLGHQEMTLIKLVRGSIFRGMGIAATHFTGMAAIRSTVNTRQPDLLHKAIGLYLSSSRAQVAQLRAVWQGQAYDTLRLLAHTLKSSSATLGTHQLAALAKELEEACRTNHLERADSLIARIEQAYRDACVIFRHELDSLPKEAA